MTAVEFKGEGLVVGEYNGMVGDAHPTSSLLWAPDYRS